MSNLVKHVVQQALFPDQDKEQWMAYLILLEKYPDLKYLSMDGYHCHGIADYTKMFYWQDGYNAGILNWTDKSVLVYIDKDFCDMTTNEIVSVWMDLCGETELTKKRWMNSL
jgi:hypothetical protein